MSEGCQEFVLLAVGVAQGGLGLLAIGDIARSSKRR